jgi:hypothetical protein
LGHVIDVADRRPGQSTLQPLKRRHVDDGERCNLLDFVAPARTAPNLDWSSLNNLSWNERYGPDGQMPYGFFYFAGESVFCRTSDAMTPHERQAGRFLYDNIDHFRRRYPSHTDIRRFVEREHEAYRRQSSLTTTDDNNNETEFYWSTGPWCADCCCHHYPHEKCLPPVRARHDDDWAIPN